MKTLVAFVTVYLLITLAYGLPKSNGQPGCQTEEELTVKYYRHFQYKTLYWECVALGQPALLNSCPIAQGFLDPIKQCVSFSLWYWTPTVAPPSAPITTAPAEA